MYMSQNEASDRTGLPPVLIAGLVDSQRIPGYRDETGTLYICKPALYGWVKLYAKIFRHAVRKEYMGAQGVGTLNAFEMIWTARHGLRA